jgi:hypothetical protein
MTNILDWNFEYRTSIGSREIHDKVVVCLNYYLGIRIEDEVFWEVANILYSKCQDILTMTTQL